MKISELSNEQLANLIENRWSSSETVADTVSKAYSRNLRVYQNNPEWAQSDTAVRKRTKVRANRIFRNTESVINALIANPPQPNFIPGSKDPEAKQFARLLEKSFLKKYKDLDVKSTMRRGLRYLYLSRMIVLKPFWNPKINDYDVRAIDPRNLRVSKTSTDEDSSEFCIEEVTDNLFSVVARFPEHKDEIMKRAGFAPGREADAYIQNPQVTYKEAWIGDSLVCKMADLILCNVRNPYWDWDGLMVTREEYGEISPLFGEQKETRLSSIRQEQEQRRQVARGETETDATQPGVLENANNPYQAYLFNHFDHPRKPYIFATILNIESSPVGQTDFIEQAIPLQEAVDRRKQDIDENASLVNGQIKVDSSVMSQADAQKLRYEARGVIWGKNVKDGVTRETGNPLPAFVFDDMIDSRNEIDNIMGATAAFRGEREGQETKAGRLALIDQSYLALNELVQVVDYVNYELFNWFYQLAKVRYTETHIEKDVNKDGTVEEAQLIRDAFQDGTQVRIIAGKTLPEDRQFKFEQAQNDVRGGILAPTDYFEVAGYEDPVGKAKNAVKYQLNKTLAVGMTPEEVQEFAPAPPPDDPKMSISMKYEDLPPDGQVQLAAKAGIQIDPQILVAEKIAKNNPQRAT